MKRDIRFLQAHREARWAVALTLFYLLGWCACAYLPGNAAGVTGLPLWFELSCLMLPVLFVALCIFMVRFLFKELPLDDEGGTGGHQNAP